MVGGSRFTPRNQQFSVNATAKVVAIAVHDYILFWDIPKEDVSGTVRSHVPENQELRP